MSNTLTNKHMKRLTHKGLINYITSNYGEPRYNTYKLFKAIQLTARSYKVDAIALFHLIIENKPMVGTHSYGYHTRYGRELINSVSTYYDIVKPMIN